jgi:hypothetical protein
MDAATWIKVANEGIPFLLLIGMGLVLCRGLSRNQILLSEKEDLVRRYILFRCDKQTRLRAYGGDERVCREIVRTLSASWRYFQKSYEACFQSLGLSTTRTRLILWLFTLALLVNTGRILGEEYYFYGFGARFPHLAVRELTNYVLVAFGFFVLHRQTRWYLAEKARTMKMDLEALFFPSSSDTEAGNEGLNNEFDPLDGAGGDHVRKDQDRDRRTGGGGGAERLEDSQACVGGPPDRV